LDYWPFLIFATIFGACVGSFLNVVIYRLPAGKSLVLPGSHCPACGKALKWWENVPVFAWFYLRAKCRYCRAKISVQYPLIEAATGLLFGGLFWSYYIAGWHPGFTDASIAQTWPIFAVHLALLASLLAATVIDAKLYIIPLEIPWLITAVAVVVLPISTLRLPPSSTSQLVPTLSSGPLAAAAMGGVIGIIIANLLLHYRWLPRSFESHEALRGQAAEAEAGPPTLTYPHPRREVAKECLFLFWPVLGAVIGYAAACGFGHDAQLPVWLTVFAGVMAGYLIGGGLLWITRILGTLAFGKEAMGLGDVHLLAAVAAVLGPRDAVVVFFLAPFLALLGTFAISGVGRLIRGRGSVIPYGPYLAAMTAALMIARQPIWHAISVIFYR